jgi:uncharacterized protein (DUF924 family)
MPVRSSDVIEFWFAEASRERWFEATPDFDREIGARFRPLYEEAAAGKLEHWRDSADGCLALCLLLDQFPRNMFRGEARKFATDALARDVALSALARNFDQALPPERRLFLYLPLEHSEELGHQNRCVALIETLNDPKLLDYAVRHQKIVERFGRFPHRNRFLGRATTPEEEDGLKEPDSSFG